MYEAIFDLKISDRARRVRESLMKEPVARVSRARYSEKFRELGFYCDARWLTSAYLDGWIEGKKMRTLSLRKAYAESYALDRSEPKIDPDDWIAGRLDLPDFESEPSEELLNKAKAYMDHAPVSHGRSSHISLDFPRLLKLGVRGILNEVRSRKEVLDLDSPERLHDNFRKREFYDACIMELEALLRLEGRYAARAEKMAAAETDPERKKNLLELAEILKRVPAEPARTFREALQSMHFYIFNLFGLYASGRIDQYLIQYYERDMADGTLDLQLAQDLVDNYCMLFSNYSFSRLSNGFMLGGTDMDGNSADNAVTAHFLRSIAHVRRPDPNYSYAVSSKGDPELFEFAMKNIAAGYGHPSLYNNEGIVDSLVRHGVDPRKANHFINTTCSEISVAGCTNAWTTYPFINCISLLDQVLHDGNRYNTFAELFEAFRRKISAHVRNILTTCNLDYLDAENSVAVDPFRVSCLIGDCIGRGKSIAQGGALYNPLMPSYIGVSNAAEALSTYDTLVYKTGEYTQEELTSIVDADFEGNELLRQKIIRKLPHYGNADAAADLYMQKLVQVLLEACRGLRTVRNGPVVPGAFPYLTHTQPGMCILPSADGRKKGDPLASCPGPLNGLDIHGPTASLFSSSSWCQVEFLGGITMNLRFTKKTMNDAGVKRMGALVKAFFARGGKQLQINCVDADELKEAMDHPEKYSDLIVRIGGYSEFFNRLDPAQQLELIRRTENNGG